MIDLLSACTTTLLEHLPDSMEVLFTSGECIKDGLPSVSMWDSKQSRLLLVDLGDNIDVRYPDRRSRIDEILRRVGVQSLRIVAFRSRQELVDRLVWIPPDTVVWIASEPKHHIDLGGNRLLGPRTTR